MAKTATAPQATDKTCAQYVKSRSEKGIRPPAIGLITNFCMTNSLAYYLSGDGEINSLPAKYKRYQLMGCVPVGKWQFEDGAWQNLGGVDRERRPSCEIILLLLRLHCVSWKTSPANNRSS